MLSEEMRAIIRGTVVRWQQWWNEYLAASYPLWI